VIEIAAASAVGASEISFVFAVAARWVAMLGE